MDRTAGLSAISSVYNRTITEEKVIWTSLSGSGYWKRHMTIAQCGFCNQENVLCMKMEVSNGSSAAQQCQKCMNVFYDFGTLTPEDKLLKRNEKLSKHKAVYASIEAELQKMNEAKEKKKEERKKEKAIIKELEQMDTKL